MIEYRTVAEARGMPGLRLALTGGFPGPWSISARAVFDYRGVPYVPVMQHAMEANDDLVAWTGRRNAPVAVFEDEPPQDGWLEIANMAERLGSGPSLFPDDPLERALSIGFSTEICGHGGFGYSFRLLKIPAPAPGAEMTPLDILFKKQYGQRQGAAEEAKRRVVGVLAGLTGQLHRQKAAGRPWLVGERLSCCDIHWACFSQLVAPFPHELCEMPEHVRAMYEDVHPEVLAALDPILIEHRDRVFRDHIGLPLEL